MISEKNTRIIATIIGVLFLITLVFILRDAKINSESMGPKDMPKGMHEKTATFEALGTVINLKLYDEDEKLLDTTMSEMKVEISRLENMLSAHIEDSTLNKINAELYKGKSYAAIQSEMEIPDEINELMDIASDYNTLTSGSFDVEIGRLIKLWGIGTENEKVPTEDEIKSALDKSNGYTVDLGAIAKGYVGDRLRAIAKEKNIDHGLLYLGGNMIAIGYKYTGDRWTIGITDPLDPQGIYGALKVVNINVVTSGNYERYFMKDGKRYHHILDANTGYPADKGIISSTIVGESSTICDALSTACYLVGVTKAMEIINDMPGYEAVFIDTDGKSHITEGMSKYDYEKQ